MQGRERSSAKARGRFVVLDGIDGCGKSTQAALLVAELARTTGTAVLHLREPGSTAVGEKLRALLLSREHELSAAVETLLFAAARRQMLDELVAPALQRGEHVVCERFHPSTFAYQAFAGELDERSVLDLLESFANEPRPDLVLVLDLSVEEALRRRGQSSDRIEDKGSAFQRRVREGYKRYAQLAENVVLLDAARTQAALAADVLREVQRAL